MVVFFQQLGGYVGKPPCLFSTDDSRLTPARAIAIPIGNTLLVNGLLEQIPRRTESVSAQQVIQAGATNLRTLTNNDRVLRAVQIGYADAVVAALYLAVAAACVSLPFAACMEWKSVKPKAVIQEEDTEKVKTDRVKRDGS